MSFPESCLFDLLADKDRKVVSGIYYLKREPYSPMAFKRWQFDDKVGVWVYLPYWRHPLEKDFKVHAVGMGCVRIDTEVLEKVVDQYEPPYFKYQSNSELELEDPRIDFLLKYGVQFNTEEMHFWPMVFDLGYDIWVNPNIRCEHWRWSSVGFDEYQQKLMDIFEYDFKYYSEEQWNIIKGEV